MMTRFALEDDAALATFTENVRALIEAGHAARAQAVLHQAAREDGLADLARMNDPAALELSFEGWDVVLGDCAQALERADGPVRLTLELVGRTEGSPLADQGNIRRHVHAVANDVHIGAVSANDTATTRITGLEPLFAELRRLAVQSGPSALDYRSTAWSIAAAFVRSVQEIVAAAPSQSGVTIRAGPDIGHRPMESGYLDLLPGFRREWTPKNSLAPNAAQQIAAERKTEKLAKFQNEWSRIVAECREIHRLIHCFPLYRSGDRQRLIDCWEDLINVSCHAADIDPPRPISWKMSGDDITEIYRAVLPKKGVPDVEGALDPAHTDALHGKWVETAKAKDFELGAGFSLFQLELAYGLKKGGPLVQDRWVNAKPYAEDLQLRI